MDEREMRERIVKENSCLFMALCCDCPIVNECSKSVGPYHENWEVLVVEQAKKWLSEHPVGCEFCKGSVDVINTTHITVSLWGNEICAQEDEYGTGGEVKINFCPFCGRKLSQQAKEQS